MNYMEEEANTHECMQLPKQDKIRHDHCSGKLLKDKNRPLFSFRGLPSSAIASALILHITYMDSLGVAPEGAEGLDGTGPEDVLVVERRDGRAHHRADPEHPLQNQARIRIQDG
jgi:hypothetical protein